MSTTKTTRNDLGKTLVSTTPLYFAAGVIDKIRAEAPGRIAAVRETDPKAVQAKLSTQAKQTQGRVNEMLGQLDGDIKRLREQAQTMALHGVGRAAEYAVKARETYDELAQRGRGAVKTWRGEDVEDVTVTVQREPVRVAEPPAAGGAAKKDEPKAKPAAKSATAKPAAGKTTTGAKPTAARKTTQAKSTTSTSSKGSTSSASSTASGATAKKDAPRPSSES